MQPLKELWKFLNTQVGLLLLGFVLTAVVGGLLTELFHRKAWEREIAFEVKRQNLEWERDKRFEILRRKLDEGYKSLEEISDLINLRFFRLHRVFENIVSKDLASAEKNWREYMKAVEEWNVKLIINQNKLNRLVGKGSAQEFNNYETDYPEYINNPYSIHGKFYLGHSKVLSLLRCLRNSSCEITSEMKEEVSSILNNLDVHSDSFIDRISGVFLKHAMEFESFSSSPNIQTDEATSR